MVEVVVGGGVVGEAAARSRWAGGAEAQTFSSFLPSFLFIVGGAGSWCRLLVTERDGMAMGSSVEQGSVQCTACQLLSQTVVTTSSFVTTSRYSMGAEMGFYTGQQPQAQA